MKHKFLSLLLLGACFLASVSLFTSCKDYDDDISANKDAIAALRVQLTDVKSALETDLNSQKSTYETQIAALKAQLQSAIDNKADAETVNNLKASLEKLQQDYEAKMSVLETQVKAANDALQRLDEKADKSVVDGVIADLAALTGKLEDESKAREAVEANLKIQMEALQDFMQKFNDANLQGQIEELKKAIGEIQTNAEISVMRNQMTELQQQISNVNANLDALNVLIERMLNSIALVPNLYIGGIEAIEFTSLEYNPVEGGNKILVSNGETEATYRLNPATVQRDGIDENNIDFVAAKAETRSADIIESPVKFNGIKEYANGLMTVYLKKKYTTSLNPGADGKITIVSLKVPRNPEVYEPADIYSENSRLAEITYTPRIASLPYDKNNAYTATLSNGDKIERPHHYSSEAEIYGSRVDCSPLALVSQEVDYRNTFDVATIVTGCKLSGGYNGTCVNQITKEQLKNYGMVFRFSIPSKPYTNDVDNNTDQQQFASITTEGVISSKTPAGLTNNEAVVGKEPIVRVSLVDTVNNKTVDVRYLKIKWVKETEQNPPLTPVQLADKLSEAELGCHGISAEFTWVEFVNEVYAKAEQMSGLSQNRFKEIYGDTPIITGRFETNWSPASDTSAPASGAVTNPNALPDWRSTNNVNGDALVGTWTLDPADIETVYCNSQGDTKTFVATIKFESKDQTQWPNLWFNWKFTIKLPKLPAINGFYDQYWLNGKVGVEHDILPIQWDTQAQRDLVANRGINYCVYDNNLMNAFSYAIESGSQTFIVKDVFPRLECGATWDLQFSYNQSVNGYKPDYTAPNAAPVWKSKGQYTMINSDSWNTFAPYKLMKGGNQALQLEWDADHVSWCGNIAHKTTNLFADHFNGANQTLLNELSQDDEVGQNGTVQPVRTHTKPIDFTVWATLNQWNYIPVLNYKAYMVAPMRINTKDRIGKFEDGVVSGSMVKWTDNFTLSDFRGYLVADVADGTYSGEQNRWTQTLWNYYEVRNVTIDTNNIRYAFRLDNGNVIIDNSPSNPGMTADDIKFHTNGNIVLSMDQQGQWLVFKNNGGSNIESMVYAYIPITLEYGFGKLTAILKAEIYPHGQMQNP